MTSATAPSVDLICRALNLLDRPRFQRADLGQALHLNADTTTDLLWQLHAYGYITPDADEVDCPLWHVEIDADEIGPLTQAFWFDLGSAPRPPHCAPARRRRAITTLQGELT